MNRTITALLISIALCAGGCLTAAPEPTEDQAAPVAAPDGDPCPPERQCLGVCCPADDYQIVTDPVDDSGLGLVVHGTFAFCVQEGEEAITCPRPVVW